MLGERRTWNVDNYIFYIFIFDFWKSLGFRSEGGMGDLKVSFDNCAASPDFNCLIVGRIALHSAAGSVGNWSGIFDCVKTINIWRQEGKGETETKEDKEI